MVQIYTYKSYSYIFWYLKLVRITSLGILMGQFNVVFFKEKVGGENLSTINSWLCIKLNLKWKMCYYFCTRFILTNCWLILIENNVKIFKLVNFWENCAFGPMSLSLKAFSSLSFHIQHLNLMFEFNSILISTMKLY